MTIQTQLKRTEWTPTICCLCNKEARAYKSDIGYHVECNPCQVFTPTFKNVEFAVRVFGVLVAYVRKDRLPPEAEATVSRFQKDKLYRTLD